MMQMQIQLQNDISELYNYNIMHPNIKNVINYIMSIPNYNLFSLNQINYIFINEICKRYPIQYQFELTFQKCIENILGYIHNYNIFNLNLIPPSFNNIPFNNNINNNNLNNNMINNNVGNLGVCNNNVNIQGNNQNNGNFQKYLENVNNSGNNLKDQKGNFTIYLEEKNKQGNNNQNNSNFNKYLEENNNSLEKKKSGNFDIYLQDLNDNNPGNNNQAGNFGINQNQNVSQNNLINNSNVINIIFERSNQNKLNLEFHKDTTIKEAFQQYLNLFNSFGNNVYFIYCGNRIDIYSLNRIGDVFLNNCTIQVIEN